MAGTIGTYAQLQSAISAWLLRSASDAVVTSAQVQNYIFLCEAELNRELRIRHLETSTALPTTAAQDYVSLPSDFGKIHSLEFDDVTGCLDIIGSRKQLKDKYGTASARPSEYAIWGSKIYLGAIPDTVYNLTLYYYKNIVALTDSNTTNDILTYYPDIYLYGSLRQAYMQIKDADNKAMAEANYAQTVDRVKQADLESRFPNGIRMKTRQRLA